MGQLQVGAATVKCIQRWTQDERPLQDLTVILRDFGQSVGLELALVEADIPYELGKTKRVDSRPLPPFWERREAAALIGLLMLGLDPDQVNALDLSRSYYMDAVTKFPRIGPFGDDLVKEKTLENLAAPSALAEMATYELGKGMSFWLSRGVPRYTAQKVLSTWQRLPEICAHPAKIAIQELIKSLDLPELCSNRTKPNPHPIAKIPRHSKQIGVFLWPNHTSYRV